MSCETAVCAHLLQGLARRRLDLGVRVRQRLRQLWHDGRQRRAQLCSAVQQTFILCVSSTNKLEQSIAIRHVP